MRKMLPIIALACAAVFALAASSPAKAARPRPSFSIGKASAAPAGA